MMVRIYTELVASFRSRRSFSHGPRCRAIVSYERGAVRKMVGLRGRVWGGNARDRRVFGPYAPDALPSHVSVFSHDFKRFERLTKLATTSFSPSHRSLGDNWGRSG